ncbi:trifunctional transcriptional regulator/proline dehydrogenase/L-glutamate gamma-semialdehyde dehydrogenase [Candidatus Fukatsuia anoeciicola]|uniref:trifunctional transcriptional regulator/proline dehydrogenase/L-glutamate gamma-semialdehyde dehydrogenase n=1 Tax=Candidatus Fukatsuia anoeciicola TaxID=2994492 RepID=UPI003464C3F0
MGGTKTGVRLDEITYNRIKIAAQNINRTPHWLIKQAILNYLTYLEKNKIVPEIKTSDNCYVTEVYNELSQEPIFIHQPFLNFATHILPQSTIRTAITAAYRRPENEIIPALLKQARLPVNLTQATYKLAYDIAKKLRNKKETNSRSGIVQSLLQEFSLSSQEGIVLMCLAEALLRIPDKQTRDILIRDKISQGNWCSHLGHSSSLFVNATTWGLLLTGRLVSIDNKTKLTSSLNYIISKSGEPLIRKAVSVAISLMGTQFIAGKTITKALVNARKQKNTGFRYSYDMLGEAALTEEDAQAYMVSYQEAIHAIGKASHGLGIYEGPGISIKLSALHPRYCRAQYERVIDELYPRLLSLILQAMQYDIGINIDAEEAEHLEISLDLLEKLCYEPQLVGWNGIGFVIQAYQKRCLFVIDAIIHIAQRSNRRLMIRLVKGAYWDSEIKRAQIDGQEGYPVYTRKIYTDIAYLACARKLLSVPNLIYPQFATHNAYTLAAIYYLAGQNYYPGQYEFQCLYGMGEPLYEQVVGQVIEGKLNRPCRVYAPVGTHETLLAYLVRRLLENGANTSFVNQIADTTLALDDLVADPIKAVETIAALEGRLGLPHPQIPLPKYLYGQDRLNSRGLDLSNEQCLASLSISLSAKLDSDDPLWYSQPIIATKFNQDLIQNPKKPIINPAEPRDIVGYVRETTKEEVNQALDAATSNSTWFSTSSSERAAILLRAAELMEDQMQSLIGILVREAGKTFNNAIAEVRESIDFLRYYAIMARDDFLNKNYYPLGAVVCISPWNFPLAIFTGQVAAALAAGNAVLAKPAEPTPLVAAKAVVILLQAGIPQNALQLLPGKGEKVGAWLVNDQRICGVIFTGSTKIANLLQRNIAGRLGPQGQPIPLIAETGGLNAMIVDSSALTEQVVTDVIASAFDSAGQRCSALRILCIQEDIAERTLHMLHKAMAEYRMGNPERLSTDIGPVITRIAKEDIENHIQEMRIKGHRVYQAARSNVYDEKEWQHGTFVMPTLIELENFEDLQKEVFGPVLHVIRFKQQDLDILVNKINATGYGLTLGIHTRIDETVSRVTKHAKVGNIYVNRNIVGAVVGVQPFGGEGLSGTGPKAGGPLYLYRLLSQYPKNALLITLTRQNSHKIQGINERKHLLVAYNALIKFLLTKQKKEQQQLKWLPLIQDYAKLAQGGTVYLLPGPTGERNTYTLLPKERVLCLADNDDDILIQLAAVLAVGSQVLWVDNRLQKELFYQLPATVQSYISFSHDWKMSNIFFDAVIFHGDTEQLRILCKQISQRDGPIISVQGFSRGESNILLERLLIEHTLSINTAAVGGNMSLMTIN